jgi:glyoxylase-like metal-dependent hydrolase (beta-lactamase superfamily II)
MTSEPLSPVNATYAKPTVDSPLEPGQKIAELFGLNTSTDFVLQRLTERTYWFQRYFYSTTFYVGDEGVLLFDPLEGRSEQLLTAIRSVTDKPVTMLAYSHAHADHIADAGAVLDELEDVPVVATVATDEKLEYIDSALPSPTQVVEFPRGSFTFEDLTVEVHGFERAAHCDDHAAYLLRDERVLHAPDLINPDQPPFWRFAGSENFVYLPANLRQVRDLEFDWINGGHGNVGEKADLDFHLAAYDDYREATAAAMAANDFGSFVDPTTTNAHTTFMVNWIDACVKEAVEALRPKYGSLYGFDAATPSNVEMVLHTLLSYR